MFQTGARRKTRLRVGSAKVGAGLDVWAARDRRGESPASASGRVDGRWIMSRFIERHPLWSLVILVAIVAAIWLIFAVWPPSHFGTLL